MSDNQSENSVGWGITTTTMPPISNAAIPGKVNGSKVPRNKLSAPQRFQLMKWAEGNKDTIKVRGSIVAATEATRELGFKVNDKNIKSICEAVGVELVHGFHGEVNKKKNRVIAQAICQVRVALEALGGSIPYSPVWDEIYRMAGVRKEG